jgi:surface antigen
MKKRLILTRKDEEHASKDAFLTRIHSIQTKILGTLKNVSGLRAIRIFRNYSAFSIVASSALLVSATNVTEGKGFNEVISGYMGAQEEVRAIAATKTKLNGEESSISLVALASESSIQKIDTQVEENTSIFDVEGTSKEGEIVASIETNIQKDPEEDGGLTLYTVNSGDTLGSIAKNFNITVNTILWANDIENENEIKPGDQIFILSVAGLTHVVKSGDTIDSIAKAYKAEKEEIISYNNLPADGKLTEGESIIIPGGEKEKEEADTNAVTRREYASSAGGTAENIGSAPSVAPSKGGKGHRFPYGYCTWYVAQKRHVPWGGNAGAWLANAKRAGYKTGKSPAVGAVVVTTENRYYGHVAYVEKVSGNTITVSEMNYAGWGKTTRRTLDKNSRVIRGYVY